MASVFLGDLDDFIQPSQACVNPMFVDTSASSSTDSSNTSTAKISLGMDLSYGSIETETIRPDLIKTNSTQTATVSLNDCLACSGCVTSAETVLITQQSVTEFLNVLKEKKYQMIVVSISPQSRASIAHHFQLTNIQTQRKLKTLFHQLGVHYVFDTSASADLTLLEAREEFLFRYKQEQKSNIWKKPPVSVAISSTETQYPENNPHEEPNPYQYLPMLSSACPGWVCYAEKSQPNALPYISTTKSPQQIMGSIVKQLFASHKYQIQPKDVYHVTVMPCYDKKLEASRKDFYNEMLDSNDVDSVLSSGEILELIDQLQIDFHSLNESNFLEDEKLFNSISMDGSQLVGATNGKAGSGGYTEYIFRYAAKQLFNIDIQGDLQYIQGRNADFHEIHLELNGNKVLSFALAYGFRNIQTIITKIKRSKCHYHFVEIMACPSGCLNGGGQIKLNSIQSNPKFHQEKIEELNKIYLQRQMKPIEKNPLLYEIYTNLLQTQPGSKIAQKYFHTRYHVVPKLEMSNPLGIRW